MVARVGSVAFAGIEVLDVDVQVQMASGLPAFTVVGLPDKAVGESKERKPTSLRDCRFFAVRIEIQPEDLKSTHHATAQSLNGKRTDRAM